MITRLRSQDFELVSGNDKVLKFATLDENDAIVDLTGATIVWALSVHERAKTTLIEYTSPTQVTITNAAGGLFEVAILDTDTEPLPGGKYYHEARVQSAVGLITTVAFGAVEVRSNIIAA